MLNDPKVRTAIPRDVALLMEALEAGEDSGAAGMLKISDGGEAAGSVLNYFDVETFVYETKAKANAGFLAGLFKTEAEAVAAGIVQEAKSYTILDTGERKVEFGVGIRLAVATSSASSDIQLTVPNLAAACQLSQAKTRAGMYVVGYRGPVGDIIPSPKALSVETYSGFVESFAALQKRIFSADHMKYFAPTVLGWNDLKGD